MRISINLASRPFVDLKPVLTRLRLVMVLLVLASVALSTGLVLWGKRERAAAEQMDALERQTDTFRQERAANEARMRQPENRTVLERAQFLNRVFAQKAFSWTSVMMDLERVLPAGVQVTSIDPAVAASGDVSIHLRASGPRDLNVDLIRNLEKSQRFLQPRLVNETAQTQETGRALPVAQGVPGGVQFDILSGYNPLPEVKEEKKAATPTSASPDSLRTRVPKTRSNMKAATPDGTSPTRATGVSRTPVRPMPSTVPGNQIAQPMRPPMNGGGR